MDTFLPQDGKKEDVLPNKWVLNNYEKIWKDTKKRGNSEKGNVKKKKIQKRNKKINTTVNKKLFEKYLKKNPSEKYHSKIKELFV